MSIIQEQAKPRPKTKEAVFADGVDTVALFYHYNCNDGTAACFAARRYFKENHPDIKVVLCGISYPVTPKDLSMELGSMRKSPVCAGSIAVYLLDLSVGERHLECILGLQYVKSAVLIDHHKSTLDMITPSSEENLTNKGFKVKIVFDPAKCGASLTWEFFNDGELPYFYRLVQDYDIWTKKLPETDSLNFLLRNCTPYKDEEIARLESASPEEFVRDAKYGLKEVSRISVNSFLNGDEVSLWGTTVFIVSSTVYQNEIAEKALETLGHVSVAMIYAVKGIPGKGSRVTVSLRSNKKALGDGVDVSEIAKRYGGGGHRTAAGFSCSLPEFLSLFEPKKKTFLDKIRDFFSGKGAH